MIHINSPWVIAGTLRIDTSWFYISDPHLNHHNVIEFCKRPFFTGAQMTAFMIGSWNKIVPIDGNVLCLGDLSMGSYDQIWEAISQLNGTIWLVPGNHDDKLLEMLEQGHPISEKINLLPALCEVVLPNCRAVLCHYPLASWHHSSKNIHLHGHTHPHYNGDELISATGGMRPIRRRINLCTDVLAKENGIDTYAPIPFPVLNKLILRSMQETCSDAYATCGSSDAVCGTAGRIDRR